MEKSERNTARTLARTFREPEDLRKTSKHTRIKRIKNDWSSWNVYRRVERIFVDFLGESRLENAISINWNRTVTLHTRPHWLVGRSSSGASVGSWRSPHGTNSALLVERIREQIGRMFAGSATRSNLAEFLAETRFGQVEHWLRIGLIRSGVCDKSESIRSVIGRGHRCKFTNNKV